MKRSALFGSLALLSLTAFAVGCSSSSGDLDPIAEATLRADSEYVHSLFQARGDEETSALKLNLADDRQFRFLQGRLRASGVDSETAPRLYAGLMQARERAIAIKNNPSLATQSATNPPRCNMFIVDSVLDTASFDSLARSSCVSGSTYTYVDQYQYDSNSNVLAYDFKEQWNAGITADLNLHSTPPAAPVWADGIAYQETGTTVESYYFMTGLYNNHLSTSYLTAEPGTYAPQAFAGGPTVTGTMTAPVDLTNNALIQLCLNRGSGSSDCDYRHTTSGTCGGNSICNNLNVAQFPVFPSPYDSSKLYVPFSGTTAPAIANTPANPYVVQYAKGWLTMRTAGSTTPAGGFCGNTFSNAPYITIAPNADPTQRLSLNVAKFAPMLGNGSWPSHCVDNGREVDFDVEIKLRQTSCTPTATNTCAGPTFNFSTRPNAQNPVKPPVSILWGCLPKGTSITLANGKKTPIENIAIGTEVLSDENGRKLTVVDIVEGTEQQPLVRVTDDQGHSVTVTSTHAMPIGDGRVVQAQELAVGDPITTSSGPATIVSIDRPQMEGAVYNLVLGTSEELATGGADNTTMYADGIRVGDSRMQGSIVLRKNAEAAAHKEELPAEFHEDFRLSEIRRAKQASKR